MTAKATASDVENKITAAVSGLVRAEPDQVSETIQLFFFAGGFVLSWDRVSVSPQGYNRCISGEGPVELSGTAC